MGNRINTIMQTCFFALSGVLPREEAIEYIKHAIEEDLRQGARRSSRSNFAAVDARSPPARGDRCPPRHDDAAHAARRSCPMRRADFVQRVTAMMLANKGDLLPVSAFPVDGTWPTGTAKWEKRNIAVEIPVWDESICIQCNKCALVCPHAAIRAKVYDHERCSRRPRPSSR
jgi:pyruvate-ferredoxin/flavodoxin oxidoreductase